MPSPHLVAGRKSGRNPPGPTTLWTFLAAGTVAFVALENDWPEGLLAHLAAAIAGPAPDPADLTPGVVAWFRLGDWHTRRSVTYFARSARSDHSRL